MVALEHTVGTTPLEVARAVLAAAHLPAAAARAVQGRPRRLIPGLWTHWGVSLIRRPAPARFHEDDRSRRRDRGLRPLDLEEHPAELTRHLLALLD
ncbi:hypothetical protein ACFFHJ_14845 [Planotetraspora thailandica]|nr:hypothetical protein [Planotetraspora thailandica]